jgi:hypothetical protein
MDNLFAWLHSSDEPRTFLYGKGGSGKPASHMSLLSSSEMAVVNCLFMVVASLTRRRCRFGAPA